MEYSIGEFARLTDLSIHTLRYYEQEKLIASAGCPANRRRYSGRDLAFIEFIKRLKAADMPIRGIRHYAELGAAVDDTLGARMEMLAAHPTGA